MNNKTQLREKEKQFTQKLSIKKQAVFERFPLVFTLLGTFGLVATVYGFEGVIDQVDLFRDNPFILLATGLTTLVATGGLYKRLQ